MSFSEMRSVDWRKSYAKDVQRHTEDGDRHGHAEFSHDLVEAGGISGNTKSAVIISTSSCSFIAREKVLGTYMT